MEPSREDNGEIPSEAAPSQGPLHYQVTAIQKSTGPDGAEGDDWYRYVLTGGRSAITGWYRGSHEEVVEYAARCAEAFNARSAGKRNPHWSRRSAAPNEKGRSG